MPWRDVNRFGLGFRFAVEGNTPADGEENPHARDPYALVAPVRRVIREMSANHPVERAATLARQPSSSLPASLLR